MPKNLLEGVRVVDFTWHLTGPLTTKALADSGAEVIRVESRKRPDIQRVGARFGSFSQYNTGKLGITLNLATPQGLELCKRLIARADIVVENFAGGAMERMGLGYETLKALKPDLIMCSSCMQGQTGPHARHPGSGHKLTSLAGFSHIAGWPDREPGYIGAYTDFVAPRFNIIAIMAALEYRRRTGKGQYLDMSQYENSVHFMAGLALDYAVNNRVLGRIGNQCEYAAPHNAYRCRGEDRWCAIAVFSDAEWKAFCAVIGGPEWTRDSRFATITGRKNAEAELDRHIEEWTLQRTAEEVMVSMQNAGVAAGVVETGEDLLDHDPQFKHRHTFTELDHPDGGRYRTQAGPHFLLSKMTFDIKRAPRLGEHNELVFKGILGLSDEEFAGLVKAGVID
jgi:benzylsuccinate CoA-transferase BbsF subunit